MTRLFLFLIGLAFLLPVLGCGQASEQAKAELLEEEKLRLAIMHSQREQLAWLLDRERQVRAIEKSNEDALEKINSARREFQEQEQKVKQQQEAVKAASAEADVRLKAAEDQLKAREAQLRAEEKKDKEKFAELIAQNRELSARLAFLETRLTLPRARGAEEVPSAQREAQKRADAKAKARGQYLEALADATIRIVREVPLGSSYENPEHARSKLLEQLRSLKSADADEQFKDAARRLAEHFALKATKGTLTEKERAAIREFEYPGPGLTSS